MLVVTPIDCRAALVGMNTVYDRPDRCSCSVTPVCWSNCVKELGEETARDECRLRVVVTTSCLVSIRERDPAE